MTDQTEPAGSGGKAEPEALPTADGPLDQLLADALEGIVDLMEFGRKAPDKKAATCAALRDVASELYTFFDHAIDGMLTPQQIGMEARAWQVLALKRWPMGSRTAQRVLAALNVLADIRSPLAGGAAAQPEPPPENDLERAVVAARADPGRRRKVWEALFTGTVHLAVVDFALDPDSLSAMTFLGSSLGGVQHTFAFTSPGRLQRLLGEADSPLTSVEATGQELTRFWPADTWLVLNPGTELTLVLSPGEVKCLPAGPRVSLPPVGDVVVLPVPADPDAEERLALAASLVPEVERIVAALIQLRATGADLPTRVAAVRLRGGADPGSVLSVLDERCANAGTGGWLALVDRADDEFAAAVAAGGRLVFHSGDAAGRSR